MKNQNFKIGEKVKLIPSKFQYWMIKYEYERNGIYKIKSIEGISEDLLVFDKIPYEGRAYSFRFERYVKRKNKTTKKKKRGLEK